MIRSILALFIKPTAPMPRVQTDAFGNIHIEQLSGELPRPKIKTRPHRLPLKDNSTREYYWRHPPGYPYQVYGGPLGGDEMPTTKPYEDWLEAWTDSPVLPGYELIMDDYTDRLYHVPVRKRDEPGEEE